MSENEPSDSPDARSDLEFEVSLPALPREIDSRNEDTAGSRKRCSTCGIKWAIKRRNEKFTREILRERAPVLFSFLLSQDGSLLPSVHRYTHYLFPRPAQKPSVRRCMSYNVQSKAPFVTISRSEEGRRIKVLLRGYSRETEVSRRLTAISVELIPG